MMNMYGLFDHPMEYPDHFVVRRFLIGSGFVEPTQDVWALDSERAADELFVKQRGLVKFLRNENDDPALVCTYV